MNKLLLYCSSTWIGKESVLVVLILLLGLQQLGYSQGVTQQNGDCKCVPITITKVLIPANIGINPLPQRLGAPLFSPQSGGVGYGDTVRLVIADQPPGSVIEYSYDNGIVWTTGGKIPITHKVDLLGRTRNDRQTSEIVKATFIPYYRRMMVIGNSIMSHGPAPDLGWYNSNGMAASAPEKDFVHLLTAHLVGLNSQMTVRLQSSGNFERYFGLSTYTIDEFNEPLQQFKPDLIIVRLGENVDEGEVNGGRNFESQFSQLIERLSSYGQPVRIVTTTSVWNRPQTDLTIRKVIGNKGYSLVDLSGMVGVSQYFASQYANPDVAAHPNDAGMQRIADSLWNAIK